ncbi:MAG: GYF domain-containing protein [Kofleriaceae bacterium]
MKIVCDACQAKYSISDDKVQGKVFKIRCKKCSNIIVVRGGAGAAEPAPVAQEKDTRVYDYGYDGAPGEAAAADDAVWHLVINQDQVGPMTVAEVQQRFAAGEVDGESFTWREGFADWLPLSQVDAFAGLVASGSTTNAISGGGGAAAIGAMFGSGDDAGGTTRSDPGDLFAAASSSSRSPAHDEDDGGDLFGSKPAAASNAAASAASSKLRGERNENSVLFSLNNLAQLASDKPAISAPSSQSGAGHATGAAGGEGSGLIDIRSMASAYMGGGGAAMGKPQTASSIGSIDDLPVFGGGGFSEPAVLVPTVSRAANNKMMYMMIAAVSLLAVVAIIMVVMLMKGGNKSPAATSGSNTVAMAEPGSAAKPENSAEKDTEKSDTKPDTAVATGSDTAKPEPEAKKPEPTAAEAKKPEPTVAKHETHETHKASIPTHTAPRPEHKEAVAAKPDTGGSCDEVSCVLNNYEGACCSKFRKGGAKPSVGAKPSGGGDLPDSLDRGMISSAIANVKARVSGCGDRSSAKGKVKVHVKVGGDGRVSGVAIESSPDASLGACVAAAVQRASFAKTQHGGSFSYPFVF